MTVQHSPRQTVVAIGPRFAVFIQTLAHEVRTEPVSS